MTPTKRIQIFAQTLFVQRHAQKHATSSFSASAHHSAACTRARVSAHVRTQRRWCIAQKRTCISLSVGFGAKNKFIGRWDARDDVLEIIPHRCCFDSLEQAHILQAVKENQLQQVQHSVDGHVLTRDDFLGISVLVVELCERLLDICESCSDLTRGSETTT